MHGMGRLRLICLPLNPRMLVRGLSLLGASRARKERQDKPLRICYKL
jgi:hypothetical protein